MSNSRGLFPTKDADFNDYFTNAGPYVVSNSARFLVSPQNLADLSTFIGSWPALYSSSQNQNTVTKTITDNKNQMRDDIEDLLRSIYDDIPNSVLTNDDRNTLNLHEPKPASARPVIDTQPDVIIHAKAGSRMQVENRVESDQTRPSRHTDSDGVEYRYWLTDTNTPTTPPTPGSPSSPSSAAAPTTKFSSKAKFIIQLAETDGGKMLNMQCRWKNIIDDTKSGPWSQVVSKRVNW